MKFRNSLYDYIKEWLDTRDSLSSDNKTEEARFVEMLNRNHHTIIHICSFFTGYDRDDIRDLYQTIAYALWKSWPTLCNEDVVDSWVRRIAINVAVSFSRHRGRQPKFVKFEHWMYNIVDEDVSNVPPEYMEIMARLDVESRALLFMRLEGLSAKEISEELGITESAVSQRLYRIRKKIDKIRKSYNQ